VRMRARLIRAPELSSRKKKAFEKNEEGLLWQIKQVSGMRASGRCL
jgi:hypothetical protein